MSEHEGFCVPILELTVYCLFGAEQMCSSGYTREEQILLRSRITNRPPRRFALLFIRKRFGNILLKTVTKITANILHFRLKKNFLDPDWWIHRGTEKWKLLFIVQRYGSEVIARESLCLAVAVRWKKYWILRYWQRCHRLYDLGKRLSEVFIFWTVFLSGFSSAKTQKCPDFNQYSDYIFANPAARSILECEKWCVNQGPMFRNWHPLSAKIQINMNILFFLLICMQQLISASRKFHTSQYGRWPMMNFDETSYLDFFFQWFRAWFLNSCWKRFCFTALPAINRYSSSDGYEYSFGFSRNGFGTNTNQDPFFYIGRVDENKVSELFDFFIRYKLETVVR